MNPLDDYQTLLTALQGSAAETWARSLPEPLAAAFSTAKNGNLATWLDVLQQLPAPIEPQLQIESDLLQLGGRQGTDTTALESLLRTLHPWRKGPLQIGGVHIETEWRSDWKWNRLKDDITPLQDRKVLDIGCGNGYHCWRMLADGAHSVIGVDPTMLFVMQFLACKRFAGDLPAWVLPFGIEALPDNLPYFDTVFSMGVLYHRRSPIDHLYELQRLLRPGGELVLETLVIEGKLGYSLVPPGRYAQMRNVWFLPSCETLVAWLERCGFDNVRVSDMTRTTTEEQRSTDWMQFQSLADFLDPQDDSKTIEGHPAPLRAIVLANKKR